MTSSQLEQRLHGQRMGKQKIDALVLELIAHPELVGTILKVVFEQDLAKENFNACWVLDHLLRKRLAYIVPHLDNLIVALPNIVWETTMRPIARILEAINEEYYLKRNTAFCNAINISHQEIMAEVCFDWLIGEHKVATKVFAMTNLFYLGETFDWIRPELKSVIEQNIAEGTAGYKSRGGKILEKLRELGY